MGGGAQQGARNRPGYEARSADRATSTRRWRANAAPAAGLKTPEIHLHPAGGSQGFEPVPIHDAVTDAAVPAGLLGLAAMRFDPGGNPRGAGYAHGESTVLVGGWGFILPMAAFQELLQPGGKRYLGGQSVQGPARALAAMAQRN